MEPKFMEHRHEVVGNLEIFQGKALLPPSGRVQPPLLHASQYRSVENATGPPSSSLRRNKIPAAALAGGEAVARRSTRRLSRIAKGL
jgi:hypothetical protein